MIDHVQGLRAELHRIRAATDDLDARVPSCPGWRVRDLLHHLGSVYRLFRRVVDEGWVERPPSAPAVDDRPEADDDRVVAWTREQADLLLRAVAELDPQAPRWNFSAGPQVGAFIPRRMHHETVVHRWDLERAYGVPGGIDHEAAVDGVREYLEVFLPLSGRWEGPPCVLHTAVAGGPTLEIDLAPDTVPGVCEPPRQPPDAVVSGPADRLLLAWWDRTSLASLLEAGDPTSVAAVRRFAHT